MAKPAVAVDAFTAYGHTVRAASLRGSSHRANGDREDDYAVRVTADHLIVVVADGVGSAVASAATSQVTAHMAADHARDWIQRGDDPSERPQAFCHGVALGIIAVMGGVIGARGPLGEIGATMTALIVPAGTTGTAVAIGVGDSPVAVLNPDRTWASAPSLRSATTQALPRHPHEPWQVSIDLASAVAVMVMTDGVLPVLGSKLRDQFTNDLACPPAAVDYLQVIDFELDHASDDRTAVTVWPGILAPGGM